MRRNGTVLTLSSLKYSGSTSAARRWDSSFGHRVSRFQRLHLGLYLSLIAVGWAQMIFLASPSITATVGRFPHGHILGRSGILLAVHSSLDLSTIHSSMGPSTIHSSMALPTIITALVSSATIISYLQLLTGPSSSS